MSEKVCAKDALSKKGLDETGYEIMHPASSNAEYETVHHPSVYKMTTLPRSSSPHRESPGELSTSHTSLERTSAYELDPSLQECTPEAAAGSGSLEHSYENTRFSWVLRRRKQQKQKTKGTTSIALCLVVVISLTVAVMTLVAVGLYVELRVAGLKSLEGCEVTSWSCNTDCDTQEARCMTESAPLSKAVRCLPVTG